MPPRGRSDTRHYVTWPRVLTSYSTCRASIHWASLLCHQGQEGRDVRAGSHALSNETRLDGTCWISRFKIRESLSNKSLGHFYKIKSSSQMSRPQSILRDRWVIFMNQKSCSSSVFFAPLFVLGVPHPFHRSINQPCQSSALCRGRVLRHCQARHLGWCCQSVCGQVSGVGAIPIVSRQIYYCEKNLTGVTTFF